MTSCLGKNWLFKSCSSEIWMTSFVISFLHGLWGPVSWFISLSNIFTRIYKLISHYDSIYSLWLILLHNDSPRLHYLLHLLHLAPLWLIELHYLSYLLHLAPLWLIRAPLFVVFTPLSSTIILSNSLIFFYYYISRRENCLCKPRI
jgi:hypothetical protein